MLNCRLFQLRWHSGMAGGESGRRLELKWAGVSQQTPRRVTGYHLYFMRVDKEKMIRKSHGFREYCPLLISRIVAERSNSGVA